MTLCLLLLNFVRMVLIYYLYIVASKNKVPDKLLGLKWSADDKEQLKKFILIYGYGRWKQIQKASRQTGGKLQDKPISEVRGFANSYVRCVGKGVFLEGPNIFSGELN